MVNTIQSDGSEMPDDEHVLPESEDEDVEEEESDGEWHYSNRVFGFNIFKAQDFWDNQGLNLFQFVNEIRWFISPCDEDNWIVWRVEEPVGYTEVCKKWGFTIEEFIL